LHANAVAPGRSLVSLLHLAEQAPAKVEGALFQLVQRDNADTDQLHARNALQSGAGSVGPVDRCNTG
jgi:hypothetical protein